MGGLGRIRQLMRAAQGSLTLLAISIASCLIHRHMLRTVGEGSGFGFDGSVSNGIDDWGPSDVSAFLTALEIDAGEDEGARDALRRSAKRAEAAEIDGDLLLHVARDPSGYLKILGLDGKDDENARAIFTRAVEALRKQALKQPKDFWEYRSGNRETVFLIEQAVLEQPRTLLYWLTQHTQDDILENYQIAAGNRFQFWFMFYLLPNTLLIAEAIRFWESHKFLVSIAVVVATVNERAQLASRLRRARQTIRASSEGNAGLARLVLRLVWNDILTETVASLVSAAALLFFWRPFWRCVPWFLCDIDFYYQITVVPISKLLVLLTGSPHDRAPRAQNAILAGLREGMRNAMPGSALRAPEPRPAHWPKPLEIPDDMGSEDGVPQAFICRISHEIMREPALVSVSG